jgi:hypothetical protein
MSDPMALTKGDRQMLAMLNRASRTLNHSKVLQVVMNRWIDETCKDVEVRFGGQSRKPHGGLSTPPPVTSCSPHRKP